MRHIPRPRSTSITFLTILSTSSCATNDPPPQPVTAHEVPRVGAVRHVDSSGRLVTIELSVDANSVDAGHFLRVGGADAPHPLLVVSDRDGPFIFCRLADDPGRIEIGQRVFGPVEPPPDSVRDPRGFAIRIGPD